MKEIWLEKYRPKQISDVFGNTEALSVFRSCEQQGYIRHLILAGPPGTDIECDMYSKGGYQ